MGAGGVALTFVCRAAHVPSDCCRLTGLLWHQTWIAEGTPGHPTLMRTAMYERAISPISL
jgi:hypothetical protein